MKNKGLLSFYNRAAINSKNYAQLGRVLKCAEASSMNSVQKHIVRHFVNMKRCIIREHKAYDYCNECIADARLLKMNVKYELGSVK